MTNSEKIRSLNDEELAMILDGWEVGDMDRSIFFCSICDGNLENRCWKCTESWLGEDADEEDYSALFRSMEPHPAPPTLVGKWEFICYTPGGDEKIIICSECGYVTSSAYVRPQKCPNCGAKMNSEVESDA